MNDQVGPYQVVDLTPGRRIWINVLNLRVPSYWMTGLLEVDVTRARQVISKHKDETGETLSFTGFLIRCLAVAVEENKEVQAYLKGRKKILLFDDVNVGVMIEHEQDGKRHLMGRIIKAANHKSFREIHDEIRAAQRGPVPANRGMPGWFRTIMSLPWPFASLARTLMGIATRNDPTIRISTSGTVAVTAVGMFGKGHSGWGISATPVSLSVIVGSLAMKPWVVDGRIEPREILHITLMFDHQVVDGAPAARFTKRFVELLESGSELPIDPAPATAATR